MPTFDPPHILVLEDEGLICMMLEEILDSAGYRCVGPFSELAAAAEAATNARCDAAIVDLFIHEEALHL